jgi:hypothetical protein
MDRSVELFEIAAAVPDHRLAKSLERFRGDLDRAGNEKFRVH